MQSSEALPRGPAQRCAIPSHDRERKNIKSVQSDLSRCDEVNSENDRHARNGADESKYFRGAGHCIREPPG